jgi:hypothetical protein
MAWDTHRGGRQYYTRSRRVNGRVVREYVGGGDIGEVAAAADAMRRAQRRAQKDQLRAERARWRAADQLLLELSESVGLLARAALLAAGYYQHSRGAWRRKRHGRQDEGHPAPEGPVPIGSGTAGECPAGGPANPEP